MIFRSLILTFLILIFLIPGFHQVQAHEVEYQAITTTLEAIGNEILLTTEVAFSFDYDSPDLDARLAILTDYFSATFLIEQNNQPCPITIDNLTIDENLPKSIFGGKYVCTQAVTNFEELQITSFIFAEFFSPFDHFVNISVGDATREIIFTQDNQTYPAMAQEGEIQDSVGEQSFGAQEQKDSSNNFFAVIQRFIKLGVEHILFGFDHILFLLATILIIRSFKNIALLVTSFTLAHSLTLILAGLGLITLTSRIVEPVIALSIVAMALRNIWILKYKGESFQLKERWLIVFGFGLIHGLGFAGALAKIGIPQQHFIPALVTFNVGVETGQFMILAVVLPYLVLMRQWRWRLYALYGISVVIAAIALFWFVERIIG